MSQVDTKPSVRQDTKPYPFALPEEDEEELEISAGLGQGYVWAMKIPRFLLEQWERLPEPGVELATLVVDNSSVHTPCTPSPAYSVRAVPPRITLRLPSSESTPTTPADDPMNGRNEAGPSKRKYDTTGIPDEYEVYVPIERAKNTYVFTERTRHWGPIGGAVAAMTGRKKREKGESC